MTKEERVTQLTENGKDMFKKSIYDILSITIILAIIITSLDVFGVKDININTIPNLFVEWVPFFLAAILLNSNLYEKGKYVAKNTQVYKLAIKDYSTKASALTGEKLKYFPEFCNNKNNEVRRNMQEQLLRTICFTYEDYEKASKLTKKELQELYDEETVRIILKAKNVTIVGYKLNLILGNYNTGDETDLGPTEEELSKRYKFRNTVFNICYTVIMTLLGIKDIMEWGWSGILIVLFKAAYTFARAYTSYFKGYNDIVIKLVNQIIRKSDIFKEYDYWFEINVKNKCNNIENS